MNVATVMKVAAVKASLLTNTMIAMKTQHFSATLPASVIQMFQIFQIFQTVCNLLKILLQQLQLLLGKKLQTEKLCDFVLAAGKKLRIISFVMVLVLFSKFLPLNQLMKTIARKLLYGF
ncbi:hypothetical protein HMPREF1584_01084 [Gardnerella vaginalis JCP8481A]|nr:hypothetical protein HMPREF1585_01276 [Gardnerella vaginalis JCP8481B]EPI42199.1 hypothetical protein HMPREF1584_01084 [Gardnerella vaginalis JCP8481A]